MRKFCALLALNLKGMLFSFHASGGKQKRRAVTGIGTLLLMGGLCLYLSGLYSFLFADQLAQVGMLPLLIMIMSALAVALGVLFTLFAAQGIIFAGRDNDLMLALPVSPFTLLLARISALYLENLVFTLFVLLPAGAAYLFYGGTGGVGFLVLLFLSAFFLALLPTLLAFIGGFLLAWLASKCPKKALVSSVLYFIFFAVLMVFMFRMNAMMSQLSAYAAGIAQGFAGWGLPFVLLKDAVCEGQLFAFLLFAALCLVPFLGVVWLFAGRYQHIVTGLSARGARTDYKLGRLSARSQRKALLQKESARFFGTPIYLFNSGVGLIMMLLAGGAALVLRGKLGAFLDTLAQEGMALPLVPLAAATLGFLVSTVSLTSCSISLEGKQLWILKEAPIATRDLFAAKVGFQLLLTLPCLLVSTVCLALALSLSLFDIVLIFVPCALLAAVTALLGLYVNLCLPRLDAPNDTVVIKQSGAAVISVFAAMGLALAATLLYSMTQRFLGMAGGLLACAAVFALGTALLLRLLATHGMRLFDGL